MALTTIPGTLSIFFNKTELNSKRQMIFNKIKKDFFQYDTFF